KLNEALGAADEAVLRSAHDPAGHAIRAVIEQKLGKRTEALQDIRTAATLDELYEGARERAGSGQSVVDPPEGDASVLRVKARPKLATQRKMWGTSGDSTPASQESSSSMLLELLLVTAGILGTALYVASRRK